MVPLSVCVTHLFLRMITFAVLSLRAAPGSSPRGGSHTTQMAANVQTGPLRFESGCPFPAHPAETLTVSLSNGGQL